MKFGQVIEYNKISILFSNIIHKMSRRLFPDLFLFCKGTVMQIEKALLNDRLYVSKIYWKFHIPIAYNIAVIYLWNLLFS